VGWKRVGLGIAVRRPVAELRAAYARADVVALDLDECLFPRYSQSALGERVASRLLRRPERPGDRRLLPRLFLGGAYRAATVLKALLGLPTPAPRLIAWYDWTLRGVPESYFRKAARRLPSRSYPLAAETVELLGSHAPTGIVSLGLDVVAWAYVEQWRGLSFFEANGVVFSPGPDGRAAFAGYDRERLMTCGDDKRRALERRMADLGAGTPMVVGHDANDLPMARLARERGGLAVGFNPARRLWDEFDAVVTGRDWEPMYALVAILAGPRCGGE